MLNEVLYFGDMKMAGNAINESDIDINKEIEYFNSPEGLQYLASLAGDNLGSPINDESGLSVTVNNNVTTDAAVLSDAVQKADVILKGGNQ